MFIESCFEMFTTAFFADKILKDIHIFSASLLCTIVMREKFNQVSYLYIDGWVY